MNIVIRILRWIDLDDEMYMFEVDSAGYHISSEKHSVGLSQKLLNDSLSPSSFKFSMNAEDVILQSWEVAEVEIQ